MLGLKGTASEAFLSILFNLYSSFSDLVIKGGFSSDFILRVLPSSEKLFVDFAVEERNLLVDNKRMEIDSFEEVSSQFDLILERFVVMQSR